MPFIRLLPKTLGWGYIKSTRSWLRCVDGKSKKKQALSCSDLFCLSSLPPLQSEKILESLYDAPPNHRKSLAEACLWYGGHGLRALLPRFGPLADCVGHNRILSLPHWSTRMNLVTLKGNADPQTSWSFEHNVATTNIFIDVKRP